MISERDLLIARRFKSAVVTQFPVIRFIVYGSRARGDAGYDSDLDIYIEFPELDARIRNTIQELAWEIGFDEEIHISPLLTSTDANLHGPMGGNPILKTIASEGVVV
jgi:predicted nucleotidyltransferase